MDEILYTVTYSMTGSLEERHAIDTFDGQEALESIAEILDVPGCYPVLTAEYVVNIESPNELSTIR